jgi:hypothetical protein
MKKGCLIGAGIGAVLIAAVVILVIELSPFADLANKSVLAGCWSGGFHPSLSRAKPYCSVVNFPEPWQFGSSYGRFSNEYEFRRLRNEPSNIIVRPLAESYQEMSGNRFVFDLDHPYRVRSGSQQEWDSGTPLTVQRNSLITTGEQLETPRIEYRGRQYSRAGSEWAEPRDVALPSPSGKWLLLQSDGGTTIKSPLYGNGPTFGEAFAQVFDAATGVKRFEIWTKFCNVHSVFAQYHNGWLDDRHLMFEMDTDCRSIIICDAEKK